ncbi:MAG TPA: hypothetical protein P5280_11285, partial [Cyclobacteriaceae bacterium]|nr:hypothetical protein [Cyclobacteriaceae bacterium]
LEVRKQEGKAKDLSVAYNNLGHLYESIRDKEMAFLYYKKTAKVLEENNINDWRVLIYANLSKLYSARSDLDSARFYVELTNRYCEEKKCTLGERWSSHSASVEYYLMADSLEKAESQIEKTMELAKANVSTEKILHTYIYYGKLELKRKNGNKSLGYWDKANEMAIASSNLSAMLDVLNGYVEAFKLTGDSDRLAYYLEESRNLEKRLFSGPMIQSVAQITLAHAETGSREVIGTQKELLELKETSIQQQKTINIIVVVMFIFLVVIAILLWLRIRDKSMINQHLNQRVQQRTLELNIRNDELNRQALERQAMLDKLNRELSASMATLSGLIQTADKEVANPTMTRQYLRLMGSETKKVRSLAGLFKKDRDTHELVDQAS